MAEQIITTPGGERLVVIPEATFLAMREALREALEDLEDIESYRIFTRQLAAGEVELIPSAVVDRILAGEHRVKVWREHRGLSVRELAAKASLSAAYLSQIEARSRVGSIETWKRLASALGLTLDDLA